ncbi:MAG: hypothetical protein Q8P78_00645, partial [bacterium]|nr:hypothetical protein [bacterium]
RGRKVRGRMSAGLSGYARSFLRAAQTGEDPLFLFHLRNAVLWRRSGKMPIPSRQRFSNKIPPANAGGILFGGHGGNCTHA